MRGQSAMITTYDILCIWPATDQLLWHFSGLKRLNPAQISGA